MAVSRRGRLLANNQLFNRATHDEDSRNDAPERELLHEVFGEARRKRVSRRLELELCASWGTWGKAEILKAERLKSEVGPQTTDY
jgi:hypothetical protein